MVIGSRPVAALLRGINVGGHNKIGMVELRAALQNAGLTAVRTHLQSGNVVFDARTQSHAKITALLSKAISETFGFAPAIVLRTGDELKDVLERVPFPATSNPSRVLITFLDAAPDPAGIVKLRALAIDEKIEASGREVFVLYGEGMGRSKLLQLPCAKLLKTEGTARNLNTLRALIKLCQEIT